MKQLKEISAAVCNEFNITLSQLMLLKQRFAAEPRHLFVKIAYNKGYHYKEIAEYLGGYHHSTMISSHNRALALLGTDISYKISYLKILKELDDPR
jgi:chromosomal replication initiation ATPase DnaA